MQSWTKMAGTNFDLLALEGAKSKVWRYFGFPAREGEYIEPVKKLQKYVYCKICRKKLNYVGNTTNLAVHLKHHPIPQDLILYVNAYTC